MTQHNAKKCNTEENNAATQIRHKDIIFNNKDYSLTAGNFPNSVNFQLQIIETRGHEDIGICLRH